ELRARGRHCDRCEVRELPAGLRPHRPPARRRQHLVPAAPGRRAAGEGTRHAGAQDQRRAGQGMGSDLGRRRGRRADEDRDRGGARPGRRADLVAGAHQGGDEPRLGPPTQPAARSRARLPARARPQRGFQGRRFSLPRQAQAQLQGQVGGSMTTPHKEITSGLKFPEGPVAMPDGSVILVEIARQTLTRVMPDGKQHVIAKLGGGPNGAAMGPDGKIYVTNNGGFNWIERPDGRLFPGTVSADYKGGSIQVVDPDTGKFETLYDSCDSRKLNGPNDLVFDDAGGFWFTDLGKTRDRETDRGAVHYAKADGSKIEEKIFPLERPNGCGLSPDGKTLYVVETPTARCWSFELSAPGEIKSANGPYRGEKGRVVGGTAGNRVL